MPPGTPPEVVNAFREAFRKMVVDKDFEAEADRAGFELKFTAGDQALKVTRDVLGAPADVVKVFAQFFKFE
jgi:tripartite-type tricarboxylate transporter receptor subunit TctC